ncbi:MAG: AAA family ATPase, partial [Bdellovibrionales bacterium]|nr:AAA family ATPase [Bdellovibrionales bacterium]
MTLHPDLELHINLTVSKAIKQQYEIVTIDQLILELLNDDRVKTLLKTCKVDLKRYQTNLEKYIESNTPVLADADPSVAPHISVGLQRVLQRAWAQAMSSGKSEVMPTDIIVSIYSETDCQAHFYLEDTEKLTKIKLLQTISHSSISGQLKDSDDIGHTAEESTLQTYCVNLNLFLKKNPHAIVTRPDFQERLVGILARKTKNNPLILGEHGVGKTYLVYAFTQAILDKNAPEFLKDTEVYLLDAGLLVAGAKFKGELEERFLQIIKELENLKHKVILFIDDIHQVLSSSSTQSTGTDISALLKPTLMKGHVSVIATSTFKDLKNTFEKNKTLNRYFQKVDLTEPDDETCIKILTEQSKLLSSHHQLKISPPLIEKAVTLSKRFIFDRFLPDKAIDVMDEVGARVHLKNIHVPEEITKKEEEIEAVKEEKNKVVKSQKYEDAAKLRDKEKQLNIELENIKKEWEESVKSERYPVDEDAIAEVVAMMTGIPTKRVAQKESKRLVHMADDLKKSIVGQDDAVSKITKAIQRNRVGLKDPKKPIGTFIFLGPTGVGKTELTRQLAKQLGVELIRLDMSEYMEKHAVSRLIGAPPGYVGYEEG